MSSDAGRPQIPQDMKAFNRKVIGEFRANHGKLGPPLDGRGLLLLTTTGARSGQKTTVVLGYRPYRDGYAVIASNNSAPAAPAWFHNLIADSTATVEVGAEKFEARARVAGAEERAEIAPLIEYLPGQQAKTEREIPLVVLERI